MQRLSGPVLSLSMIDANYHYTGYVYCGPVNLDEIYTVMGGAIFEVV